MEVSPFFLGRGGPGIPGRPVLKIKVRLFARYRELAGRGEMEVEVEEGATVAHLKQHLEQHFPQLQGGQPLVAVNAEHVEPGFSLSPGDEVALLPPLSGG